VQLLLGKGNNDGTSNDANMVIKLQSRITQLKQNEDILIQELSRYRSGMSGENAYKTNTQSTQSAPGVVNSSNSHSHEA
jgi:hypothetical protein